MKKQRKAAPALQRRPGIALDSRASQRRKDENGYLHVARTHLTKEQVVPYYGKEIPGYEQQGLDPEAVYYGYRPAEEIEKALSTFNGMPLLIIHKQDSASAPLKDLRVGSVGTSPAWNAPYLDNSITITDQEAIDGVEDETLSEISCGYFYDPDFTPGEFNGVRYDFVMRNLRGNHVALVKEGRAGPEVCVADALPSKLKRKVQKPMKLNRTQVAMRAALAAHLQPILAQDAAPADLTKLAGSYKKPSTLAKAVVRKYAAQLAQDAELDADDLAEVIEAAVEVATGDPEEVTGDEDECPAFDEDAPGESLRALLEGKVPDDLLEKLVACASAPAQDEDPEDDDDDIAEDEEDDDDDDKKKGPAMDANSIIARARKEAMAHARSLTAAAAKVRPIVGELDAMAFDSAEDIFGHALKSQQISIKKYNPAGYEGMVDMVLGQRKQTIAQDHAPDEAAVFDGPFANLGKIKIGK